MEAEFTAQLGYETLRCHSANLATLATANGRVICALPPRCCRCAARPYTVSSVPPCSTVSHQHQRAGVGQIIALYAKGFYP